MVTTGSTSLASTDVLQIVRGGTMTWEDSDCAVRLIFESVHTIRETLNMPNGTTMKWTLTQICIDHRDERVSILHNHNLHVQ